MKKISNFLVNKRFYFFGVFLILAIVCCFLMGQVKTNSDLSKYLPEGNSTKVGMEIIKEEFNDPEASYLKVMFTGEVVENEVLEFLKKFGKVEIFKKDENTLFKITIPFSVDSNEATNVFNEVSNEFKNISLGGDVAFSNQPVISIYLLIIAFFVMFAILLLMCKSWIEPLLFLITIGVAIVINLGTNIVFGSISTTTTSIAAILQLCLSMDYSIMLMNRYRQDKTTQPDNKLAMSSAIRNSFRSIFSSSFTTMVGMLVLLFMSFTIGFEMGLVLAKGVFLSFLCVFTILPTLILLLDKVLEKTKKKELPLQTDKLGAFSFKLRKIVPIAFVVIFALSFTIRGAVGFSFTLPTMNDADKIFPDDNVFVVVYENKDEDKIDFLKALLYDSETGNLKEKIVSVDAFSTTIGVPLTSAQIAGYMNMPDDTMIKQLFFLIGLDANNPETKISIYEFFEKSSPIIENTPGVPEEQKNMFREAKQQIDFAHNSLVGKEFSRIIISTKYANESDETFNFIKLLNTTMKENFEGKNYVVGNSAMAYEMSGQMNGELNLITILTVIAIFMITAIAFWSAIIPLILVGITQCAIFITMGALGVFGGNLYFLAVLIVQALLMGAIIDYGILYTNFYLEGRKIFNPIESTKFAYNKSIHTILTSSLILFSVTGIIGLISNDATISQVCSAIAIGTFCATTLVVFVLPPFIAIADRIIIKKPKKVKENN